MRRSAVAADILAVIEACMGNRCQHYAFFRSRGIPPAECPSISSSWIDRSTVSFEDCSAPTPCGEWIPTLALRITITDVCPGPDSGLEFDWMKEDAVAACFDDDVDTVEECIACADWTQLYSDHFLTELRYGGTTYDVESEGGGFSAYVDIILVGGECCGP